MLEQVLGMGARTLFGTHFHTIANIAPAHSNLGLYNFSMDESDIGSSAEHSLEGFYTYKLSPGVSKDSYGLLVAKLANVPPTVIERAQVLLKDGTLNKD